MAHKERLLRTTVCVTLVIILSKALGFARDMITANYFGTGMAHDAYQAAYSLFYLPVLLLNSCITSTVVPMYLEARKKRGLELADRFGSNTINIFALLALAIGAVIFALAEPLVHVIYSEFDAQKAALTIRLVRIMLLTIACNVVSIVLASLLNAREKYISAQITGFPLSLSVIVASVLFAKEYGVEALAWGVCAANLLQTLVLIPPLAGWFHYSPVVDLSDSRFQRLMRLAAPAVLSMAVSELNHMIDQKMASGIEGGISAMTLAYRLITFMTGILIVPLTTIMFSRMSRLVTVDDRDGILEIVRNSVRMIALVMLPIVAVAAVMNGNVIQLAYMRGAFDENSLAITSGVFLFYVIGVMGFGIRDLLNRTFHAMQDTRVTMYVSMGAVALNIGLNFLLRAWMGVKGLALATTISGSVAMLVLFYLVKRRFGHLGLRKILPDLVKILIAAAVCAVVAFFLNGKIPAATGTLRVFLRLGITTLWAFLAYVATCLILRVSAVRQFLGGRGGQKNG